MNEMFNPWFREAALAKKPTITSAFLHEIKVLWFASPDFLEN
jgi:hypothetical protein